VRVVFVHGWSVTHTDTYGEMPQSLVDVAADHGLDVEIDNVYLGKYISFHDEVSLDDIASAFDTALRELAGNADDIQPFSCITHSTGGPVVRHWVNLFYGAKKLSALPLQHLVMLAPANHGSALAVLGKERVGRIKAWFNGVEPGQRVLDWLALGSDGQWSLNEDFLDYQLAKHDFFPFVLTGEGVDSKFYDFLNAYLVEPGSDGVVRVASANMNFRYLCLLQSDRGIDGTASVLKLEYNEKRPVRYPQKVPIGIFSDLSHSGNKMGIMAVRSKEAAHDRVVGEIIQCLLVRDRSDFQRRYTALQQLSEMEQNKLAKGQTRPVGRYSMLVFRVRDHVGNTIRAQDYDIFLLGGASYRPDKLPTGFFVDKQLNRDTSSLVYYVDADKMSELPDGCYGVRVVVRPQEGFSYYMTGEFRAEGMAVDDMFAPNETTYIDIIMNRYVDQNVFRFSSGAASSHSFSRTIPSGKVIPR
jgi:hypothetical protein